MSQVAQLKRVSFPISGTAMSQVEGSELYQRPQFYDDSPQTLRAGKALQLATGHKQGKGFSYSVTCDVQAAEVIREYFQTQAEIMSSNADGADDRRDARAYRMVAERISELISRA